MGVIIEPENPDILSRAIIDVYNNPEKAEEYGRKGREFAIKYLSKEMILPLFEKSIC